MQINWGQQRLGSICNKLLQRNLLRSLCSVVHPASNNDQQFVLERLEGRELIRVKGAEVVPFLQGLITNDIAQLQAPSGQTSLYAMFLNNGGRVLYDTIIYRTNDPDMLLVECDKRVSPELRRHLRTYRVRRQIDVDSIDDEYSPWAVFSESQQLNNIDGSQCTNLFVANDPRLPSLGTRVLAPQEMSWAQLVKQIWRTNGAAVTKPDDKLNYRTLRYSQGVAEGTSELPPGKCFPLEANGDFLNGISFSKGCYIGQELTARVHHSGVVRKRYMPLRVTTPVLTPPTIVKSVAGANIGTLVGHEGNRALALLRVEQALNAQPNLVIDGDPCYAERPNWWPNNHTQKRHSNASD